MNINHSRAKTFHSCPRKYFWLYEFDGTGLEYDKEQGLTEGRKKMVIGSMVHAGLAALYSECSLAEAHVQAEECLRKEVTNIPPEDQEDWDDATDMVRRMLTEYAEVQMPLDDFSPIVENIETEFRVQLGENCWKCGHSYSKPYISAGFSPYETKQDGVACPKCLTQIHYLVGIVDLPINRDGQIKVMDHKTAGSVSDLFLESWHYSQQLIGYAYGYGKAMGQKIKGYEVNILRKLKTIGTEKRTHKQCPSCKNGKIKKLSCDLCNGEGKVEREPEKVTSPFQREKVTIGDTDIERFIHNRLQTVRKILHERMVFQTDPKDSWPMNPESCFTYGKCPFLMACHSTSPEKWFNPSMENLSRFVQRKPDYVDTKDMIREEVV